MKVTSKPLPSRFVTFVTTRHSKRAHDGGNAGRLPMPAHSRPDDNWLIDRHLAKCEGWEYCSKSGFQTQFGMGLNRIGKGPWRLHRRTILVEGSFIAFVINLFWRNPLGKTFRSAHCGCRRVRSSIDRNAVLLCVVTTPLFFARFLTSSHFFLAAFTNARQDAVTPDFKHG